MNLTVFNMITRINESKTLTKNIPCNYRYEMMVEKICKKNYAWNPSICACECDKN